LDLTYGSESLYYNKKKNKKTNLKISEMKFLRSAAGYVWKNQKTNTETRE
jgi:hypothetical protein